MAIPIVFLPGIMGSRLYFENSGLFWDPDDDWRMLKWLPIFTRSDEDNRLAMQAQQPASVIQDTANVNASQSQRGWSGVSSTYYGSMLNYLDQQLGQNQYVYAIGYDWRQDMVALGDYVNEKIDGILAATDAKQVALVTHSMGGLVYLAALRNGAIKPKIAVVLHICIPASGAVVIYRRTFTGMLEGFDGTDSLGDRAFRLILGDSREGFLGNFSGLPGAAQLSPGRFFPVNNAQDPPAGWNPSLPDTAYDQLYSDSLSPPGVVPSDLALSGDVINDLNDRITDIYNFQNVIGDPSNGLLDNTYLIYGSASTPLTIPRTDVQIFFQNGEAIPFQDITGDGTVPVLSATSLKLAAGRMVQFNVEHSQACNDNGVQGEVKSILQPYV